MNILRNILLYIATLLIVGDGAMIEVTKKTSADITEDIVPAHELDENEEMLDKIQSISNDISDGFLTSNGAIDEMKTAIHENREILTDMKEMLLTIIHKQVYFEVCGKKGPSPLCNERGTCKVQGEDRYTCQCDHGWMGEKCEARDHCVEDPCDNGGECINAGDDFKCICEYGFYGERCHLYGMCYRYLKGEIPRDQLPDVVKWTKNVKCDRYGDFARVQTVGQEAACVYQNGTFIDFPKFDKSLLLNTQYDCQCAYELTPENQSKACSPNGSYPPLTCAFGMCFCADEEGKADFRSVREEDVDALQCHDAFESLIRSL